MGKHKALKGAIAAVASVATLGASRSHRQRQRQDEVRLADGKYVAESTGFNGDAVLSYELKDKSGNVVSASDSSTPVSSGVRVKTAKISR